MTIIEQIAEMTEYNEHTEACILAAETFCKEEPGFAIIFKEAQRVRDANG